ncbi:MAG: transcriptional regulator [Flavobacteriales bacterium]|nr:MAG: transcriptional regulator [Flavobacteriales bacterium]
MKKWIPILTFGVLMFLIFEGCKTAAPEIEQDREEVIMRKIGHNILLSSGNAISLVKPIIKEENQYRIQFDSDFGFPPEGLVIIIDSILGNSHLNKSYLVKVEKCETGDVVYSYEVDIFSTLPFSGPVTCQERAQPEDCYEVVILFFEKEEESSNTWLYILLIIIPFFLGLFFFRKKKVELDSNKIKLGDYIYDPKKMVLIRKEKTIELTSKENELLSLLYEFANETVNKETILNKVWGDEGDYVGRTLDVYISKLRKKLENDSSIELKNIRGIGYKLIVEN